MLVVNPKATATTNRTRDVIARALGSDLKVDVVETTRRGHARDFARRAAADNFDVVVALGGDGTVNEVVNGLLTNGPSADLPDLAVVPGGSTNVFVRSLGLPRDPVEATGEILDALRQGRRRVLGMGRLSGFDVDDGITGDGAGGRWFIFCAGIGLDAEVVREVEVKRTRGRRSTPMLFISTAVNHFFTGTDRRHGALTLRLPDGETVEKAFIAIVSNAAPWTYLGSRPIQPTPDADYDAGLDFLAVRRLRIVGTLRVVRQMLSTSGRTPRTRQVVTGHDLPEIRIDAARPMACQVDGEYIGEREQLVLTAVPRALRVIV
jgi:diacylglycerol kinase family enzyme